jgi:hypothetical protein
VAVVAAAALLEPLSAPAAPDSPKPRDYRQAKFTVRGHTVRAAIGTYCLPSGRQGEYETFTCSDTAGPPGTKRRLPIHPRDRVLVTLKAAATDVRVSLAREGRRGPTFFGDRQAHRRRGDARKWVARFPRRLRKADLLVADVDYEAGDAEFGVSVRRR